MNRQTVQSANIRSVGYDEATAAMEVEFTSGAVYHYADVPKAKHAALLAADSKGSYFGKHIRPHHKFKKL